MKSGAVFGQVTKGPGPCAAGAGQRAARNPPGCQPRSGLIEEAVNLLLVVTAPQRAAENFLASTHAANTKPSASGADADSLGDFIGLPSWASSRASKAAG